MLKLLNGMRNSRSLVVVLMHVGHVGLEVKLGLWTHDQNIAVM